jgi:RNA polymerase sigma factor (sigma-70 family)
MSSTPLLALIARCCVLCRPRTQGSDAELLARFVQQRDAAAFEELLERYAPLVWGVCRRIVPNEADCEDAFQAVFLALVRQAAWLDGKRPLGAWLHTVAVRVARKASAQTRRQRPPTALPERTTCGDVADDVSSRELFRLVDEEIERLPARLRVPILLCCLQGRTRDEAAEALGCSVAAVKGRLERGRHLLRRRLARRGVQLPAAFLALGLTSERIRASLWAKTLLSVRHTPAPAVAALAEATLPGLMAGKGKLALVLLLSATGMGGVFGSVLISTSSPTPAAPPQAKATPEVKKPEAPRVRTDRHGDPLPEGAITRLGTVRWRHGFFAGGLTYSPDGKMIAAVGAGRAVTLWDAATGKEIHRFPNLSEQPSCAAFSPDGKLLATGGWHYFCRLWDVASGKEVRQIGGGAFAFSADGKLVTTAKYDSNAKTWDKESVRIWDANTGKELRRLDCRQGELWAVAYSPDGKILATAGKQGTILLWDAATGKKQHQLTVHTEEVWKIMFSPDGKLLASSSTEGTIRLWKMEKGHPSRIVAEKKSKYENMPIAFSPDGSLLAAGDASGTISLWDVADGGEKRHWQASTLRVNAIAFSPDGKTLASGAAWESIRLWDVATGRERHPSEEHLGILDVVRFSPDGAELISISRDRRMLWWDLATQTPRRRFSWKTKGVVRALSADGGTLVAADWSTHKIHLWDTHTGKLIRLLAETKKSVEAIDFSPDGRFVAAGVPEDGIHIWDARDGKEVRHIKDFASAMMSLCFSPDSKSLASAIWRRGSRTLRLWEVDSGKEPVTFPCFDAFEGPLAFSPDGKVLAAGFNNSNASGASSVRLWDTATGKERNGHTGHGDMVGAIAFSGDGKLVASGTGGVGYRDNSVHIWEAATGRLIRRFEGHHSCVNSMAFSPDGLSVASGAGDATILLWDITGRRVDGRWHVNPLTPRQLDACWTVLADADAAKAYDAVWTLVAAPEQALPFLRKQLPPMKQPDAKSVARLIADLDSDEFRVREKATKDLGKLGDAAAPTLRQALQGKPALEMRRRLRHLLDQSRDWTAERLREHRAIQALEHIGTPHAKEVLEALAAGMPGVYRTEAAREALQRMRRK